MFYTVFHKLHFMFLKIKVICNNLKIKKIQIIVKNVGQYIFSKYIQTLLTQKVCHWPPTLKVTNNTTNKGLKNTIHVISLS